MLLMSWPELGGIELESTAWWTNALTINLPLCRWRTAHYTELLHFHREHHSRTHSLTHSKPESHWTRLGCAGEMSPPSTESPTDFTGTRCHVIMTMHRSCGRTLLTSCFGNSICIYCSGRNSHTMDLISRELHHRGAQNQVIPWPMHSLLIWSNWQPPDRCEDYIDKSV